MLVKILILVLTSLQICNAVKSQTVFNQKGAQIKNLIAQIAKLQVYMGYVKKGYNIVDKGLTTIGDIKDGDFKLHQSYFNSLKKVSPVIKKYARIAEVIDMQLRILALYKKCQDHLLTGSLLSSTESAYINHVFSNLLNEVGETIQYITDVLTEGELAMKEDERIKRIEGLYNAIEEQFEFAQSFTQRMYVYAAQKQRELNDLHKLQKLIQP